MVYNPVVEERVRKYTATTNVTKTTLQEAMSRGRELDFCATTGESSTYEYGMHVWKVGQMFGKEVVFVHTSMSFMFMRVSVCM